MAKLTKKQTNFLIEHDVPIDKTFDATGYSTAEYKNLMKDMDLLVAYGVIPCEAEGHKLRLRSGHCFQCNPDMLRYHLRHYEDQYLYLAYSISKKLIKVGITKDLDQREESLNETRYGDIDDWQIISSAFVYGAGVAETQIHNALSRYKVCAETYKDGRYVATRELFKCTKKMALEIFKRVASD